MSKVYVSKKMKFKGVCKLGEPLTDYPSWFHACIGNGVIRLDGTRLDKDKGAFVISNILVVKNRQFIKVSEKDNMTLFILNGDIQIMSDSAFASLFDLVK